MLTRYIYGYSQYLNGYGYGTNNTVSSLPQCANETFSYNVSGMASACAQRLEHVPRGWDNWVALRGNAVYYNYTLSVRISRLFGL